MKNKIIFKTEDPNGKELELVVIRPSPKQGVDAQLIFNREWRKAEEAGSLLRSELDTINDKRGLWGPEQRKKVNDLETEIVSLERTLRGGANSLASKDEARSLALKIRTLRGERMNLLRGRMNLDNYTAESFAESARLQYLVSACTFDAETGKLPYFKNYDDFLSKSEDKAAIDAFSNYIDLTMGDALSSDNYEDKWLKDHNYMNDKGYLIDSSSRLIDTEGKLINENYEFVNEDGTRCDREGKPVDAEGNYIVEYKEFN